MAVSAILANDRIRAVAESLPRSAEVCVYSPSDWLRVAPIWRELEQTSPYSSFYLSTDWTAAWLEIFGALLKPQILIFKDAGNPVGSCLLVRATERRGPFRVKRIYLNTGGGDPADRTLMEFNDLLCRAGREHMVAVALWEHLRKLEWDEFCIDGVCASQMFDSIEDTALRGLTSGAVVRPSFYVNLDCLRRQQSNYETSLSPNTRQQLRRSLKLYARQHDVRVETATDLPTAERFFDEMCVLHQARWTKRGETGAFAPGRRLDFHRALIRKASVHGAIQMIRVSSANETIGILYNFVRDGKVYFFQSGFHYRPEKHLKPGLVTHAVAVQHCLQAGLREYDLLAGDARYKRSLAKECRQMAWVVFARPRLKLKLIGILRSVKHRVPAQIVKLLARLRGH